MTELSRQARALLEAARGAEDPHPEDRTRVLVALSARIAVPPMTPLTDPSSVATSAAASTSASFKIGSLSVAAKVKIIAAMVVTSAGGLGTWQLAARQPVETDQPGQQARPAITRDRASAPAPARSTTQASESATRGLFASRSRQRYSADRRACR